METMKGFIFQGARRILSTINYYLNYLSCEIVQYNLEKLHHKKIIWEGIEITMLFIEFAFLCLHLRLNS